MKTRFCWRVMLLFLLLAMSALACNLPVGVPRATPTLAPTNTPSRTPSVTVTHTSTATLTATVTLTHTLTPTPTNTATATPTFTATTTASLTATQTPTTTSTPTNTLTSTATFTATSTLTPSSTSTGTVTPSFTPSNTATWTLTPTLTATPSATFTLSPTPTVTPSATHTPRPVAIIATATKRPITFTPTSRPTLRPSATSTKIPLTVQSFAVPSQQPVITEVVDLGILPSSTPVPVTATLIPTITAIPSVTPLPAAAVPTQIAVNPLPTAVILPTVMPTPLPLVGPDNPAVAPSNAFVVNPYTFGVQAPPGSVAGNTLYADVVSGQAALVENQDIDYPGFGYTLRANQESLVGSPLPSDTIRFKAVQWSPNGAMLAFIAETPGSRGDGSGRIGATISDGLWVWTVAPGAGTQFTHHAQRNLYPYEYGNDAARMVRDFVWSPDSAALLVQYNRAGGYPDINGVINPDWDANADPVRIEHEFASWSNDGRRVLVSGLQTNGGPILGWVDRGSGQLTQMLVDGAAQDPSLWLQSAVEMGDGRIAFIGAPYYSVDPNDGRNSAEVGMYIYNVANVLPVRVSLIGGGPVREATWNDAHSAVLLRLADGRTVIAQTNGGITDITGQVGGSNVTWGQ